MHRPAQFARDRLNFLHLSLFVVLLILPHVALADGSTWTVPSDWNSANNTIEVIGGGGRGVAKRD